nr:EOG090X05NI [Cyclestheria hislopi]
MTTVLRFCISQTAGRIFYGYRVPYHATLINKFSVYKKSGERSSLYLKQGNLSRPFFFRNATFSTNAKDANANHTTHLKVHNNSKWRRLWKPFFWLQVTFGFGLLAIALKQLRRKYTNPAQSPELIAKDWELLYYRVIPFRAISRAWGWLTSRELPQWAREPVLGLYAKTFKCNLEEAAEKNLMNYPSLAEFFRRKLKDGVRPVDDSSCIVAPSDGTVLHFGKVTAGMLEQVKGVSYSLDEFLGPAHWRNGPQVGSHSNLSEYEKSLCMKSDTDLYHCVIYLAPGDYHCFHSPVDWSVTFRRHFPGELFSVNPSIAKWVAGLFSLNERAVYVGQWRYGFFSMTPVGATNVGSIRVYMDRDLRTNCSKRHLPLPYYDRYMSDSQLITLRQGEIFGEFNLGSTIVLIFEAPKNFQFKIEPGQKIRMGQGLNQCLNG